MLGAQLPLDNIYSQSTESSFEYTRPPWLPSGGTDSLALGMGTAGTIWSSFSQSGTDSVNSTPQLHKSWSRVQFARLQPSAALPKSSESCKICSICLTDIQSEDGDAYHIAACKQLFHDGCIRRWKKKRPKCPLCRSLLPKKSEKIGVKKQLHSLGDVNDLIQLLLLENEHSLSQREKIGNIVLAPFGFAVVLLTLPLLLLAETMFVCLVSPVFFISLLVETFRDRFGIYCNTCGVFLLSCYSIIISISLVLPLAVFIIVQIPFFVIFAITFCFKVCCCKRRWQDAIPYMANRMIFDFF